ncbi:hypothetical protein Tco_0433174 [Tanacetum coccineum]
MFTEQIIPFYENVKQLVQKLDKNIVTEVTEYMRIFDELDTKYERYVLANNNLKKERKNLLIQNDCLIANSLEKDICSIVLAYDIVVPPSSNFLYEELTSNCDREHSKVVELEAEILKKQQMLNESEKHCAFIKKNHVNLQVKFQKYKECLQNQRVCDNSNSTASNAIFEINKLKDQLQGKDDTIRNLQTQINITRMLNVGSTVGSFDKQALETELTQLKDALTSVRIQIDGYKAENVNLKRRYEELSKSNAYSRSTFTAKINALTAENAKLKTELSGKKSSGSTASEKPKVLASGMYTNSSKYVPPPKRANWVKPTPLPKKKQVTFQEPPRTSNRPTQKPPVQQNKKPNVPVNLSTRTKPATESRKPMPKSHTRNHRILPSKSVNARRAADHNRKLNVVDHNQFVIRSLKSVNTKTPQAKHSVNHTKKVWKATRNHNVNTTKTAWRPTGKVVGSVKPQWKPTGRHFALYDNCPLTRIMEPIVEPLELTPSVSSSSKVTMISRFTDCKLSNRKAGSKGHTEHLGDRSKLINYVDKFIGTVRFRNDQFATIIGYGDYKLGNTIISRVYYVEGLSHNLFLVRQFRDGGLEVAFRQHTCHIRNKDMVDLLQGAVFRMYGNRLTMFLKQRVDYSRANRLQLAGGKLRNKNAKESWALLEDLAIYDNERWNDPRDVAKLAKAISLPQDVISTFDRSMLDASSSCSNAAYSSERNHLPHVRLRRLQTSVLIETSRTSLVLNMHPRDWCPTYDLQDTSLSKLIRFPTTTSGDVNKIDTVLKAITDRLAGSLPSDTVKNPKLKINSITSVLFARRGFLATANAVIDCRMAKIAVGEGITRSVFGVKGVDLGAIPINLKRNMWESEDLINNPINWNKLPKNKDGAWHAKIKLIEPDREEFTKTLQSIPTTRKLSDRESPREIIDQDHFYDT